MVESPYGGTDGQHLNVVFPRFFNVAESTRNVEKESVAMPRPLFSKKAPNKWLHSDRISAASQLQSGA